MAATLTAEGDLLYFSIPFEKEETPDGNVLVYGKCTDYTLDSDLQRIDLDWSEKALQAWMDSGPNIRVQHQAQRDPAGVGISVDYTPDGHYLKALIVESEAKNLVKCGALRAFSVGISRPVIDRDPTGVAKNGIIRGNDQTEIAEVSIVDRPANPSCGFQMVKKSSSDGPGFVVKSFGNIQGLIDKGSMGTITAEGTTVSKSADTVAVDLPKDVSVAFSPTDLAKLLEHRRIAEKRVIEGEIIEKRDIDPDVGGGVDRDKIPSKDHVDPKGRRFPVVTPGDVEDAVSSYGRAKPLIPMDTFKKRLTAIARRKGPSFVAALPEKWKDASGMKKSEGSQDVEKAKKGGKKPFAGAAEPFGKPKDGKPDDKSPDKADEAKPDVTKKPKMSKKSYSSEDMTAGGGKPSKNAKKPKKAEKGKKVKMPKKVKLPKKVKKVPDFLAAEKGKTKVMCPSCGAVVHDKHNFCPECGKKIPADAKVVEKNHNYLCLNCGYELDKGEQYCPNCGKKNPGYLPEADTKVKTFKGKKPTPGKGVAGRGARNINPVPAHREPDGKYMEEFERDASIEDGDEASEIRASDALQGPALKTRSFFKSIGVPAELGALHDLTCASYHPMTADKAHPGSSVTEVDVAWWQQKAFDAAASSTLEEAREAAKMWQHALALKNADPVEIVSLRDEAHKMFCDANPGPGTFPEPGELMPGQFKRPYLTEGHANPSPGRGGSVDAKVPTEDVEAADFHRDHLDAGHASDSPSNKSHTPIIAPAPLPPGMSRTYYRNAERDAARSAMTAMHDHIAHTFPDLCPMEGPGSGGEPAMGARPVPIPSSANKSAKGKKVLKKGRKGAVVKKNVKRVKSAKDMVTKSAVGSKVAPSTKKVAPKKSSVNKSAARARLVKAAVAQATGPLSGQLKSVTKALKTAQRHNKKLQARVDTLGAMPDPREAPFRGVAQQTPSMLSKSAKPLPAGARSVAEYAEQVKLNEIRAMQEQARSHDPAEREAAWNVLMKMGGLPTLNK